MSLTGVGTSAAAPPISSNLPQGPFATSLPIRIGDHIGLDSCAGQTVIADTPRAISTGTRPRSPTARRGPAPALLHRDGTERLLLGDRQGAGRGPADRQDDRQEAQEAEPEGEGRRLVDGHLHAERRRGRYLERQPELPQEALAHSEDRLVSARRRVSTGDLSKKRGVTVLENSKAYALTKPGGS